LVENIYCNWSGGCGMGSLGKDTDISDITYRNIYTWNSNNMMFIKSNGGSGSASNLLFENFIGKRILPEKQLMNEESLTLWLTFLVRPR
jgi:rhamnogalacturonan hydrolase